MIVSDLMGFWRLLRSFSPRWRLRKGLVAYAVLSDQGDHILSGGESHSHESDKGWQHGSVVDMISGHRKLGQDVVADSDTNTLACL